MILDVMRGLVATLACAYLGACSPMRGPGEPCRVGDCIEGSVCARVTSGPTGEGVDECIALCDRPADDQPARCDDGSLCYGADESRLDVWGCFPGGEIPIGAPCGYPTDCVRGAFCSIDDPVARTGTCAPACNDGGCGLGEPCAEIVDCAEGLICASTGSSGTLADPRCVATCDPSPSDAPYLCADGSACWLAWEVSGVPWACYPGGSTVAGAACTHLGDCERGTLCVELAEGAYCTRVCVADRDCAAFERCTAGLCLL